MAYTGYRINTYIDVNPNSPTFNTTREERVSDTANCSNASADWQVISQTCEVENGLPTGYYVTTTMCVNPDAAEYGQTASTKVYNLDLCPQRSTDPNWQIDESFTPYCRVIYYEPGHVQGNDGSYIVQLIDENMFSSSNGQTVISAITDTTTCPVPDTSPDIEAITTTCEIVEGEMTGYELVTGLDKNVYSPTYLSTTTTRRQNTETCPPPFNCETYSFNNENVAGAASGGSYFIANYANIEQTLTAISYPEWLSNFSETVLAGRRSKGISCDFAANSSESARTGTVVFSGSSGNCTFTATVSQSGASSPSFDCNDYSFNNSEASVNSSGESNILVATYVNSSSLSLTATSYPAWISNITSESISVHSKGIYATIAENSSTSARTGTIVFSGNSGDCSFSATVTQSGASEPSFDCETYSFSSENTTGASSGGSYFIANYANIEQTLTPVSYPAWLSNFSETVLSGRRSKGISCDFAENSTTSTRTGTVVFSGSSGDCSFSATVTQSGESVDCSDFQFTDISPVLDKSAHSSVLIAQTSLESYEMAFCSLPEYVDNSWIEESPANGTYDYYISLTENNDGEVRLGDIIICSGDCEFTAHVEQNYY